MLDRGSKAVEYLVAVLANEPQLIVGRTEAVVLWILGVKMLQREDKVRIDNSLP